MISIAAGVVHSMALTDDGALFYWGSSDPDLRCQQVYLMIPVYCCHFQVVKANHSHVLYIYI